MHKKYPHIRFETQRDIATETALLLGQCEAYVDEMKNAPVMPKHYDALLRAAMITGARATTAIEGNTLSEKEIGDILDGGDLPRGQAYQSREVKNILAGLTRLLGEAGSLYPLPRSAGREGLTGALSKAGSEHTDFLVTAGLIQSFHRTIGKELGTHLDATPGRFREKNVIVGTYRCPDYRDIPELILEYCSWINEESGIRKNAGSFHEVIVRAIIAHAYLLWIHPFSDGNGRTARMIESHILLRGGAPATAFHILSNHYHRTRPEYYRHLQEGIDRRDLTGFLTYAISGFRDGLVNLSEAVRQDQFRISWQKLIEDRLRSMGTTHEHVFTRRRTLILEIPVGRAFTIHDVPELTIGLARHYSGLSQRTLRRDLDELLTADLIIRENGAFRANTGLLGGAWPRRLLGDLQ